MKILFGERHALELKLMNAVQGILRGGAVQVVVVHFEFGPPLTCGSITGNAVRYKK